MAEPIPRPSRVASGIKDVQSRQNSPHSALFRLQYEVRSIEQLRKGVDNIMQQEVRETPTRKHDVGIE